MRVETSQRWLLAVGLLATAILLLASLKFGTLDLTWADVRDGLRGLLFLEDDNRNAAIIGELRLPRALMAWLVGATLAISGTALQGLLRNPLAAPSLIGISSGAAFAAALVIVLPLPLFFKEHLDPMWAMPIAAFFGSLLTSWAVFRLAQKEARADTGLLLLAGVAINSLCGAGVGFLTYAADDAQLRNITFWSLGSVAGASWKQIAILLAFFLPSSLFLLRMGRTLNAWTLGESEAQLMGINVERNKRRIIFFLSLAVGASVAFSGIIGFVGLVVPHLLRLRIGSDHTRLLAASLLWGGVLLLASDLTARTILGPSELPIGIVTAGIGSPYFLYLLRRNRGGLL